MGRLKIENLCNQYFAMRHGEDKAKVKEIILSSPINGLDLQYSLTEKGKQQVKKSVVAAFDKGWLDAKTVIVSSPFSRALYSAELAEVILKTSQPVVIVRSLRERWFGKLEKTINQNYQKVWSKDEVDPNDNSDDVESVLQVLTRVTRLIEELEFTYKDEKILLVSHGDVLQILQTEFVKTSCRFHRQMPHLELAEIRELTPAQ